MKKRKAKKKVSPFAGYSAKIVADSKSEEGVRITTFEITFPLIILAELNTHRVFSRNTASSRAIPVKKLIEAVRKNPFVPERFPKNQSGMSNREWVSGVKKLFARWLWRTSAKAAASASWLLMWLGVHKQIANRIMSPFMWTTAVVTATEWDNFFRLRTAEDAQPEMKKLADMMYREYVRNEGKVKQLKADEWHMPYVGAREFAEATRLALTGKLDELIDFTLFKNPDEALDHFALTAVQLASIGRCARVSYLKHGKNSPLEKDIMLAERLLVSKHLSPTEHVATPAEKNEFYGNFRGWKQYRKGIRLESGDYKFEK